MTRDAGRDRFCSSLCTTTDAAMPPAASAEQSFRANLSQFRWARGNTDDSQPQAQDAPANPFARFYHAVGGGYIPLRSNERSNEEEAYFALSRWDRCVAAALQPGWC